MQSEAYRKDFVKDLEFLKACESNKALQLDDVKVCGKIVIKFWSKLLTYGMIDLVDKV